MLCVLIGSIYFFLSSMAGNPTFIDISLALYSLMAIISVSGEVIFYSTIQTVRKYDYENKNNLNNNILINAGRMVKVLFNLCLPCVYPRRLFRPEICL
ncbi:DUF6347 domain-containing protein [Photorhabdus heterorhabditis]|uniref:Uncharacterized protein n=1 Tax=Photorhabdus heterorhabditis TaxID=880156 RepID=A0ABR5KDA4_9GAMM|nr:hypothetical protein AM629_07775 [Photorhabdus heterorhabditis]